MLVDVSVPELSIDSLSYESSVELAEGVRVIVEVGTKKYTGFVLGRSAMSLPENVKIKSVEGVIDERPAIPADVWDLALWSGRISMSGTASALRAALPVQFYTGEKVFSSPENEASNGNFTERNFFNPLDSERIKFFLDELESGKKVLILFPRKDDAKSFFLNLPERLKSQSSFWHSETPKYWSTWKEIHSGRKRIVVAAPGGVFAPFSPQKIIVEDEANPAHVIPYTLNLSARSLAGHRAAFLNAEFITAGRMPSLKTYVRKKPPETLKPDRKNIILADIHNSRKEELQGIEGSIPLTFTLTSRTHKELACGRNVIWILNRTGESSEVFCENCGESVLCQKCGGTMKSLNDGEILKCSRCGMLRHLPPKCEKCGFPVLIGKRPGLDALEKIAAKYFPEVHVFSEGCEISAMKGLILSTTRGLTLCDKISPSLVAWLDLDSELSRPEHTNRFNVFKRLLDSYWRGREADSDSDRKLLIQTRRGGLRLAEFLATGWTRFIRDELEVRQEFELPPFFYIVEIECSSKKLREKIINLFMDEGFFVMDPGDKSEIFYVNTESLESVRKILEPEIFRAKKIRNTKKNYINIKVISE